MSKLNIAVPPSEPTELQHTVLGTAEPRRMLNESQVLDILPFGRTTLHNLIKTGGFPRGTYVSPNRRAWFADEIARWQRAIETDNPYFDPHRGRGKGRYPRGTKHTPDKDLAKKESRSSP
jgi:predicted DNA-binding transcriptional regulator AlpA